MEVDFRDEEPGAKPKRWKFMLTPSWMMLDMVARGTCPAGFIVGRTNPVMVQGAVLANLALMHELDPDPFATIQSGDAVRMRPAEGVVEVVRRRKKACQKSNPADGSLT